VNLEITNGNITSQTNTIKYGCSPLVYVAWGIIRIAICQLNEYNVILIWEIAIIDWTFSKN